MINLIIVCQHESEDDKNTAFIHLMMLPSRPLPWAKGTYFDPIAEDHSGICIQLLLDTEICRKNYEDLVLWMRRNVHTGEAQALNLVKSARLWQINQSK